MTTDSLFFMVLRVGVGVWCVWVAWMLVQTFRHSKDPGEPAAPESDQKGSLEKK